MREIKFRAWHTKHKKMFSPEEMGRDQLTLMPDGQGFINVAGTSTKLSEFIPYMIPLQYTGLKDKNGKEIYEGDILAIHHLDKKHYGVKSLWQVTSELTSWGYDFCWEHISGYECSTHVMREDPINYEIIGNIYENPEQLKKEDN